MPALGSGAVDAAEVAKFDRMAARWWDPDGEAAPLHAMNPCRLDWIIGQIAAQFRRRTTDARCLDGLAVLDVGCGGGLVTEPLARLGAVVTGIDASSVAIDVAAAHAAAQGLPIEYRCETIEAMAASGAGFDVVTALEIVEHVPDATAFVAALAAVLRPGGLLVMTTLNRTPASFLKAVVGAEYLLRWLPPGTHDWRRFVTPEALAAAMVSAGLRPVARTGMVYAPLSATWRLDPRDLSVNYAMAALR